MASYPGSLWAGHSAPATLAGPPTHEDMHEDVSDELVATQTELGTNPSGSDATVAVRLANAETTFRLNGGNTSSKPLVQGGEGVQTTDASGDVTITFPQAFAATPVVIATNSQAALQYFCSTHTASTTTVKVRYRDATGAAVVSASVATAWIAIGQRV
jgi:hypothetical protein